MFEKVLIANRGEIAIRVIRACRDRGIATVAVYSDADRDARHVRMADAAYHIGPARASESYLDIEQIVAVGADAGADAVHPGYGFLAENPTFAEAVIDAGMTWIGPPPAAMRQLGDKTAARSLMADAGVPVIPGSERPITEAEAVQTFGETHGYPVAIKAAGGGGGRGMKIVHDAGEAAAKLDAAVREATAYFDDARVYLERFIEAPRHVEIQVIADAEGTAIHLGERDCTLQRRHQKLIEEAPSPVVDATLREAMGEAAIAGVTAAGYTSAGTVEFLVTQDAFYFMEVNTRIQVEHPVTELVCGVDLVDLQLSVAAGAPLPLRQEDVHLDGHAIEFRINTEDARAEFRPTTGVIERYDPPRGMGVRVEDGVTTGATVGGEYDSMIAKLIVHGRDRAHCLARAERALGEYTIDGVQTIIPFHAAIIADERFRSGAYHTRFVDEELDISALMGERGAADDSGSEAAQPDAEPVTYTLEVDGRRVEVAVHGGHAVSPGPQQRRPAPSMRRQGAAGALGDGAVTAEMQGTILGVSVAEGDEVRAGDVLCVLEAMKMENEVTAATDGTVTGVAIDVGDQVDAGDPLVQIE
jgi:acetyl-CoA/propionyl-CoA carboxylase biotin carboxyl carrier protein